MAGLTALIWDGGGTEAAWQFQWSVIATDALHVLMIAPLWLPGRSRRAHLAGALGR
jgi:hypothetical protein